MGLDGSHHMEQMRPAEPSPEHPPRYPHFLTPRIREASRSYQSSLLTPRKSISLQVFPDYTTWSILQIRGNKKVVGFLFLTVSFCAWKCGYAHTDSWEQRKHHCSGNVVLFEIICFISSLKLYSKPLRQKIKSASREKPPTTVLSLPHSNSQRQKILEQRLQSKEGLSKDSQQTRRQGS